MSERALSSPETAERVYSFLFEQSTERTASVREVAEGCGVGRNTAHLAIRRLIGEGRVRVDRLGTGDAYPSRYVAIQDGGQGPVRLWRCISCDQWMVGVGLPEPHYKTFSPGAKGVPSEWVAVSEDVPHPVAFGHGGGIRWHDSVYQARTLEHLWVRRVRFASGPEDPERRTIYDSVMRYCYRFSEWTATPTGQTIDSLPLTT